VAHRACVPRAVLGFWRKPRNNKGLANGGRVPACGDGRDAPMGMKLA
jgi:hypothetical protein